MIIETILNDIEILQMVIKVIVVIVCPLQGTTSEL